MNWLQGAGRAQRVLYVQGENDGMMLVHPSGLAGTFAPLVQRDPEGQEALATGRYSIRQFGLREALERTLHDWKQAREKGTQRLAYAGISKPAQAGGRECYTLRSTALKPDSEEAQQSTVHIDRETWLQVGTILRGAQGELIGSYVYRDIELNPHLDPEQFQREALTR
jgi:hypothetical protein